MAWVQVHQPMYASAKAAEENFDRNAPGTSNAAPGAGSEPMFAGSR
jgi:hypothetical protein